MTKADTLMMVYTKIVKKIIEFGLYLLAFTLPIQTRLVLRAGEINGGFFEYKTVSLYGTDLILITLVALFVVYKIKNQESRIKNQESRIKNQESRIKNQESRIKNQELEINELEHLKLFKNFKLKIKNLNNAWFLIGGLELIIFISIFFSIDKAVSVYKYILFLLNVGMFWVLTNAIYSKTKLIYAFVLGAVFQAGLGIWQFFSQSTFSFKWLGMAEHVPYELGNSVIESLAGGRWLRAYGGVDHPNLFGGFLVLAILMFINLKLIRNLKFQISNFKFQINFKCFNSLIFTRQASTCKHFIFNLFLFILFLGLFLSFSRSACLALIVGMSVMLVLAFYKKIERKKLMKITFVFFLFGIVLSSIFSELVFTRFSTEARLEKKSYVERVESINVAREVISKNWLFGVGIGNYTQYVHENINSDLLSWDYQPVHNVFLLVLAEIGVFGLLFFFGLILDSLFLILRKSSSNIFYAGIIMAVLTLFMFDHWWWSLHFGGILFWFVLGVGYVDKYKTKNYN